MERGHMATGRSVKIAEKRLALRNEIFPQVKPEELWDRKVRRGFTTIPRALPLVMSMMDAMSKAKPLSSTYLDLWCRGGDESFVTLNNQHGDMAFHAGFTGERAVTTWRDRMRRLAELGFIAIAPGTSGDLGYAVIMNPYLVVKRHAETKHSVVT